MSVDFPTHPKLMQLPEEIIPLAGWLTANAWCYCGENKTDGEFPPNLIYRMSFVDKEIGKELIAIGLWHEAGHDCPKCPQPRERMLISHDYLEHQRSKEEVESLKSARSEAGAKGAGKRWANRPPIASAMASATGDAIASVMANGWQADGNSIAEVEVEVEVEKELPTGGPGGKAHPTSPSQRTAPQTKGHRILEDWVPGEAVRNRARERYPHPDEWWRVQHEKFMNYWLAKAGAAARKTDWDRTWSNWILEAVEREPRRTTAAGHVDLAAPVDVAPPLNDPFAAHRTGGISA